MCVAEREEPAIANDVLLAALAEVRQRKEQADRDMRVLLAYAREIAAPRPYRLADLAKASGMSISGIRTAYTSSDIEHAIRLLNTPARSCQQLIAAPVTALLAALTQNGSEPGCTPGQ